MADQVSAKVISERSVLLGQNFSHKQDKSNTQMEVHMTTADTECAQALLDLARSFSSQHYAVPMESRTIKSQGDSRSVLNPLSSNSHRSPPKRGHSLLTLKKGGIGRGSPSKRGRGRGGRQSNSLIRMFDPTMASKLGCKTPESLKEEILRRISQDHTYANLAPGSTMYLQSGSSTMYPQSVDPAFYNLLEAVECTEGSGESSSNKPKVHIRKDAQLRSPGSKEQKYIEKKDFPSMNFYSERSGNEVTGTRRSLDSLAQLLSAEINIPVKNGNVNTALKGSAAEYHGDEQNNQNLTSPDLYQPYDDKYKNFNLLLKCLTNDSPEGTTRKRCYSQNSGDTADTKTGKLSGPSQDVKCQFCMKVFSNGIYLRKHKLRAHPNIAPQSNSQTSERVSCPTCLLTVERQKLEQHMALCSRKLDETLRQVNDSKQINGSNNATCQFCGVRMRRQMLVKHLAHKHCIENKGQANLENDGNMSESGSSTLSGTSDVEDKTVSGDDNIIQCDICYAFVPKPMLSQHVAEKHFNMVSGTGYTAGLQNGSVKDETDNKSETISDSHSYNNNVPSKPTNENCNTRLNNKNVSPPSAGTFKQYMLHRFLSENPSAEVTDGSVDSLNCNIGRAMSPNASNNNVASVIDSVSSVYGPENGSPENGGTTHTSGSYTAVVVRSDTSSLHDTIHALAERISPQMQV